MMLLNILLNQLCMTYMFSKRERSLIFSALKMSNFLKSTLLPNFIFIVIYTGNKKIVTKIIFRWCLNRYYLMILSRCYYKSSHSWRFYWYYLIFQTYSKKKPQTNIYVSRFPKKLKMLRKDLWVNKFKCYLYFEY